MSRAGSFFTEISFCFRPGQAKVVPGSIPCIGVHSSAFIHGRTRPVLKQQDRTRPPRSKDVYLFCTSSSRSPGLLIEADLFTHQGLVAHCPSVTVFIYLIYFHTFSHAYLSSVILPEFSEAHYKISSEQLLSLEGPPWGARQVFEPWAADMQLGTLTTHPRHVLRLYHFHL